MEKNSINVFKILSTGFISQCHYMSESQNNKMFNNDCNSELITNEKDSLVRIRQLVTF
jgi:hypothetical protein